MVKRVRRPGVAPRRGTLREVGVAKTTLRRYKIRVNSFFLFLELRGYRLPRAMEELDTRASEFVDHLWLEGEPEGWATDFASGLKRLVPRARKGLVVTTFYLNNWRRTVTRRRALPFTALVIKGLAGFAFAEGRWGLGAMLLAGFVGLLRTDEILDLRVRQIMFFEDFRRAVLILPDTKSGAREGKVEKVLITDPLVARALQRACHQRPREYRVLGVPAGGFNDVLRRLAGRAGIPGRGVSGYSLRRGGATWHFLSGGSLSKTTVHGRWAHEKTARIYIDGAMAQQAEWSLRPDSRRLLLLGGRVAAGLLAGAGGGTFGPAGRGPEQARPEADALEEANGQV